MPATCPSNSSSVGIASSTGSTRTFVPLGKFTSGGRSTFPSSTIPVKLIHLPCRHFSPPATFLRKWLALALGFPCPSSKFVEASSIACTCTLALDILCSAMHIHPMTVKISQGLAGQRGAPLRPFLPCSLSPPPALPLRKSSKSTRIMTKSNPIEPGMSEIFSRTRASVLDCGSPLPKRPKPHLRSNQFKPRPLRRSNSFKPNQTIKLS